MNASRCAYCRRRAVAVVLAPCCARHYGEALEDLEADARLAGWGPAGWL